MIIRLKRHCFVDVQIVPYLNSGLGAGTFTALLMAGNDNFIVCSL